MSTQELIAKELAKHLDFDAGDLSFEEPKDSSFGDLAFPCFIFAKTMKKAPAQIAADLAEKFSLDGVVAKATGPYVNFTIDNSQELISHLQYILGADTVIKKSAEPKVVLVESPGPNTNKPLHLGHLRNLVLGDSIVRAMKAIGKDVHTVNVNNDRGIHICKSMVAYQNFGEGKTPESEGRKSDHFVGDYYVLYAKKCEESLELKEKLEAQAEQMLIDWEEGKAEVIALWKKMNDWALDGFKETYARLGCSIEKEYYESETYKGGKDIILKAVEDNLFYKNEKGAIEVDLTEQKLDKKVLLRSNGTAVYITQDINMAKLRYDDFKFDEMIYIVGNEQEYHFKVLFEIFKLLGWPFGESCRHFSYGMISLPEGKMKSREGNVVDTDNLIINLKDLAVEAITERYDDIDDEEIQNRAEAIAMSAIRFFFLKFDPLRNFVYDPKESLAFEGETGPYIQYTYARIKSILRKAGDEKGIADFDLLDTEEDKQLLKHMMQFQGQVEVMANDLKPHVLCSYLMKLSQLFNSYYSKHKIIQEDKNLQGTRLELLIGISKILKEGLSLLGIETLDAM